MSNNTNIPSLALPKREGKCGYRTGTITSWKKLQDGAVEMRRNPTEAESLLWDKLRRDKLRVHFRRQHVVGAFIVDFICLERNLIVEVDGDIHDFQKERDAERTESFNDAGFIVIRFTNNEVITNLPQVISRIELSLSSLPFGEG